MSNNRSRFAPEQPFRIAALPITVLFAAILVGCGGNSDDSDAEDRASRIEPVAKVEVEDAAPEEAERDIADSDGDAAVADEDAAEEDDEAVSEEEAVEEDGEVAGRSGEEVYQTYCTACHAAGIAGAPRTGNEEDWEPRMARGLEENVQSVINGKGAMPPRGGGADLTDEEITHAVIYLFNRAGGDF